MLKTILGFTFHETGLECAQLVKGENWKTVLFAKLPRSPGFIVGRLCLLSAFSKRTQLQFLHLLVIFAENYQPEEVLNDRFVLK